MTDKIEVQAREWNESAYRTVRRFRKYSHAVSVFADKLAVSSSRPSVRIVGKHANGTTNYTDKITFEGAEARENLRKMLRNVKTLYTILHSVSSSGMSRHIGVRAIIDNEPRYLDYLVAHALDYKLAKDRDGLVVSGCGMDMGFHVVYSLSSVLFGNGYRISQRWL